MSHISVQRNPQLVPNSSCLSYMEECIYKMCQSQCLYTMDIVARYGSNSRCGGLGNQRIYAEDPTDIEDVIQHRDIVV